MVRVVGKFFAAARDITQYRGNGLLFQVHDSKAYGAGCLLKVYADDGSDDAALDTVQCFGPDARQRIILAVERYLSSPAPVLR